MQKWLVFLFLTILCTKLAGQSSITGRTVESSTGEPVEFVNVLLKQLPDSSIILVTVSGKNGNFRFDSLSPGNYFLETNLIGFEASRTSQISLSPAIEYDAGTLVLKVSEFRLEEVQITASSPLYVNANDRKIYHAAQDLQAQSGSVTDLLQNIPSITVESEGEIQLRGSSNITFLLNGKTSGLLKNNASTILEQIPAHTIERIEIITNPSAKYKPDGMAGIINIVTKKNIDTGFNGSIQANASTQKRYNGNISLNYHPGKINIALLSGYWQNYSPRSYLDYRISRDSFFESERIYDERNNALGKPRSFHSTLSMDYEPDENNSFGFSGSYSNFDFYRENDIRTLETSQNSTINDFTTVRTSEDDESELELNAYAERRFRKEDHVLSVEASFFKDDELDDTRFEDIYTFPSYPSFQGHTIVSNQEEGTTVSLDYGNPLGEDIELETGYEGEFYKCDLDYFTELFDRDANAWQTDAGRTSRFLCRQDIHALYATLSRSFESWEILAGVRAEQTDIESRLPAWDSIIPNQYFNLYPSLHVMHELSDHHKLGVSYSRRVNRPDPDELNPFPDYEDIRDIEAGNPYLKPEQMHSVELGYEYQDEKISFLPALYFRYTYDALTEISFYINDTTLFTTQENLSSERSGGLEVVFSYNPAKDFTLNINSNLFYHQIDASNLGYESDRSIVTADAKVAAFWNATPTTKLQLNSTVRSARLTPQGRSLPLFFMNLGLRQDLFNKNASLTLTVSDVFNTMRWRYIIDTPELYQKVERKRTSQILYVGFSYRFGISSKKEEGSEFLYDDRI